jgi:ApbE superfamily uncharacterized protein (UPF0280 family)
VAQAGALGAATALDRLVPWLETARLPMSHPHCQEENEQPRVLRLMIKAVEALQEDDFTPMAAVAGAFSQVAAQACRRAGADRVIVNNGGDIALWARPGQKGFRVGLVQDLKRKDASHILSIGPQQGIGGVATSGLGGRSLSKGVASAVTCWGKTCPQVDAAATSIANATQVEDPAVKTCVAEALDPMTDLRGQKVVASVGKLGSRALAQALAGGRKRAQELINAGLIIGCLISVQGRMAKVSANAAIATIRKAKEETGCFLPQLGVRPALDEDNYGPGA